jgi:hypothetical protein
MPITKSNEKPQMNFGEFLTKINSSYKKATHADHNFNGKINTVQSKIYPTHHRKPHLATLRFTNIATMQDQCHYKIRVIQKKKNLQPFRSQIQR